MRAMRWQALCKPRPPLVAAVGELKTRAGFCGRNGVRGEA